MKSIVKVLLAGVAVVGIAKQLTEKSVQKKVAPTKDLP